MNDEKKLRLIIATSYLGSYLALAAVGLYAMTNEPGIGIVILGATALSCLSSREIYRYKRGLVE